MLQYIASGLLGVASFEGGLKTAALAVVLHYFIALAVAAIYYGVSLKLSTLHTQPNYHLLRASMVVVFLFFGYQKWSS